MREKNGAPFMGRRRQSRTQPGTDGWRPSTAMGAPGEGRTERGTDGARYGRVGTGRHEVRTERSSHLGLSSPVVALKKTGPQIKRPELTALVPTGASEPGALACARRPRRPRG